MYKECLINRPGIDLTCEIWYIQQRRVLDCLDQSKSDSIITDHIR